MSNINNLDIYTQRMSKSIEDKVDFYEHLLINDQISFFIDFGCGDGSLIKYLAKKYPLIRFIGYDISPEMINLAKEHTTELYNISFYSDFKKLYEKIINAGTKQNNILNFSSVMHEVLTYSTSEELKEFWCNISYLINQNIHYVTFRDMCVDAAYQNIETPLNTLHKLYRCASESQIKDFESVWGSLKIYHNAIHFLLKYRYVENWERENNENYLAIPSATAIQNAFFDMCVWPAEITYSEHYTLPYLKEIIKEDFDFNLNIPTHLKFILEV